jgi:molybdenum cofactor biosynthesis protein B
MTMGVHEHKKHAPDKAGIAVLSISSTRSLDDDESGWWIKNQAEKYGHEIILHRVVNDDVKAVAAAALHCSNDNKIQAVVVTGGTGIAAKDVTIEAIRPLFAKELTAFSALFAVLSFEQIGSAAILSRATAGLIKETLFFCVPGSVKACKLACEKLIFPELGHLVRHAAE